MGAAATALALASNWLSDPAHRHFTHELIGARVWPVRQITVKREAFTLHCTPQPPRRTHITQSRHMDNRCMRETLAC